MTQTNSFWLVWNELGFPPHFRHATAESAVTEAGRLAKENPDQAFFVLKAVGFAKKVEVAFNQLCDADGGVLPF